jgi:3-isopropylmalate/(R)-2-methylmalate dehydratase small subunit
MKPFKKASGRPVPLPLDNVDTDQIIPASFLKVVDREGLAEGLFHGWRFRDDGTPDPDFVLHHPRFSGATILLVGENFGCGSSREHAPWALQGWGFRVILGRGFADIFKGNAHRNGLLTVTLPEDRHAELLRRVLEDEGAEVSVDLEAQVAILPDGVAVRFEVDPFARHCLLNGVDPMGHLLEHIQAIEEYEEGNSPRIRVEAWTGGPPFPDAEATLARTDLADQEAP